MSGFSRVTIVCAAAGLVFAAAGARAEDRDGGATVVVELFTSQACSSCVAAADYFYELSGRDDIVALGWHVDYWNALNTKNGRWADPYSIAENTERQRRYNKKIRKRSSVYTPQVVVAGAGETVGSARDKVDALIAAAKSEQKFAAVAVATDGGDIVFDIGESDHGGNAYLLTLKPQVETKIARGENAGLSIKDVNVVTDIRPLGAVRRVGARISAAAPAEGENCALIVQEPRQGRIIGAAYCSQP